jgi:uncharacterized protein VirK/YbjX
LGYDEKFRKEGELVLSFKCDELGGVITASSFSFEEKEPGKWVCRIGCVQGYRRNDDNSCKAAQKLLHGLRPKSLIVFVIQELSRQLGIIAVHGAGDTIQSYRRKHFIHLPSRHAILFDYNAIWRESGGKADSEGWYELPLMPQRRNIAEVKANKRPQYLRRYSMLDDLSLKIRDAVNNILR